MMRLAVVLLAVLTHFSAHAQDMYDFRGLRVGASLSEIRKFPYPDAARWPGVKLICTGDKERAQISSEWATPDPSLLKIGVVACSYYRPTGRNFSYWGINFVGITRMQALLYFSPAGFPEEQRSRLYMISLLAPTEHFDAITAALEKTHGKRSGSKPLEFQSEGKIYDNLRLWWQASDGILITERYITKEMMYVSYQHQSLSDAVDRVPQ